MNNVTVTEKGGGLWETLTVKDDVIARSQSKQVKGVNRHSGKTYSRFENLDSTIFSWKRNDRLRVYHAYRIRGQRHFNDVTAGVLTEPSFWTPKSIKEAFLSARGEEPNAVFRREYPLSVNCYALPGITAHLRHSDATTFTKSLFGVRHTRKDLVRAVGGVFEYAPNVSTAAAISAARSLSGLVPTDWLVDWLPSVAREFNPGNNSGVSYPVLRRMLRTANTKQLRRLVTTDGTLYGLHDSIRSFQLIRAQKLDYALEDIQFTSFKELHDALSRDQRKLREPEVPVAYRKRGKALAGEYGDYRIVAPRTTYDLIDWGQDMNNCIGGYGYAASTGTSLLYGVYQGSTLLGNMEINPKNGDIRQLLGKHNAPVADKACVEAVHAAVKAQWPNANVAGGWQGNGWGDEF